jgi:hypothetical protein
MADLIDFPRQPQRAVGNCSGLRSAGGIVMTCGGGSLTSASTSISALPASELSRALRKYDSVASRFTRMEITASPSPDTSVSVSSHRSISLRAPCAHGMARRERTEPCRCPGYCQSPERAKQFSKREADDGHVFHCSLSLSAEEGQLTDQQ